MKKKLLMFFCIALALPVFAQRNTNEYSYYLSEIMADDMEENYLYTYNDNCQVISAFNSPWGSSQTIDSMHYNELDQLVRISTYQHIDEEWRYVYYIDYTYNERGLRESRTNYNIFDGIPNLGGVYTYFYDENDNLYYWELDFCGGLFQKGDLTYNENNQVTQEIIYNYYSGDQELRTDYEYDDQGNLILQTEYTWSGSSWTFLKKNNYTFDDNGNCITTQCFTANIITEKHEYQYDTNISIDIIAFPINPEVVWSINDHASNVPLVDKYYTVDVNDELQYVCDYLYVYEKLITGVAENSIETVICPNPAQDRFMIKNDKVGKVEIYSFTGKVMYSSSVYGEKVIDVSDFASGIYIVKLNKGDKTDVVKLVVK